MGTLEVRQLALPGRLAGIDGVGPLLDFVGFNDLAAQATPHAVVPEGEMPHDLPDTVDVADRFRDGDLTPYLAENRPEGRSVPGIAVVSAPDLIDDALGLVHGAS